MCSCPLVMSFGGIFGYYLHVHSHDWKQNLKKYARDALGRLYTVHPNNAECFYVRLLLINVRGRTSFQELKTVNGHVYATFREACQKLNIFENDAHLDISLADASNSAQPQQIRRLFSIILTTCFPANRKDLWGKYKDYMSEDILHHIRRINANSNIQCTSNSEQIPDRIGNDCSK
ncbi:ATP-dependent DNA helicase [Trichonephila clavata]|uniref:ATP-dependent DNA helicase n=1 Tax=Trichonephila clavata TaxID=2740835 RepID=A0A8X6HXP1_TRICU|nr:ATP-dependent DNA helicase [Trichonephila clavata]